jgi:succinyl-diaminopimelate desuccinylase
MTGDTLSGVSDRARATVSRDEMVGVVQKLVRIPSENPPGDTRAVCEAIREELEPAGWQIEMVETTPGFANIVATYEFDRPGRTLILNGHVDVVPVGDTADEWKHDPWGAEIDNGKLYGRGSCDMKGQVAGLLAAARWVAAADLPLGGKIVFTAVADEEQGGKRGTGALIDEGKIKGDAVLVVEGSDRGVTLAHRGLCFVELTTHGRNAHASVPENGINAVEKMVDVLHACRSLQFVHTAHPLLGSPSVAIGTTIAGGSKTNVVPDLCKAGLDIRHVPGMNPETIVRDLEQHFRETLPEDGQPDIEVKAFGESGETSPDEEIVKVAVAAHEREFGFTPKLRGERAATDGWWFTNRAKLPTIVAMGPGDVESVHCIDENIDVEQLERYTRVYADIIATYLSNGAS